MCNTTKGNCDKSSHQNRKDVGRKTLFLPYPLIAARLNTQMFKKILKRERETVKHIRNKYFF